MHDEHPPDFVGDQLDEFESGRRELFPPPYVRPNVGRKAPDGLIIVDKHAGHGTCARRIPLPVGASISRAENWLIS